ncbi:flagellar filament capping protein FliD [Glaciecola sp. 2405UD65-10]|uniref:flagellar filament capping protein FliD n=1 Tax=Glaciecola sp. 2405UD65-10 TaxID=3397244 RepID=UPI003B5CC3B8
MSIQSLGVGSGLDLESLVQGLLEAERAPKAARLDERDETINSEISAIGQVKSKISEFEEILEDLQQEGDLSSREPTIVNPSEDNDVLSATPTDAALPGTYNIAVTQLASGSRIETASAADGGFTDRNDEVLASGTADLTFKIDNTGDEFSITVEAGMTLAELREAINNSDDNFGVKANIINTGTDEGGAKLVFTSDVTGAGNDLQIVNTNDAPELARLTTETSTGAASNLSIEEKNIAKNAIASVDGIEVQSDSNKFDETIQSVRFDVNELSETDTNGDPIASRLTIGFDEENLKEKINEFVDKFNELREELDSLSGYGSSELENDGALAGDSMIRGFQSGLASILSSTVSDSSLGSLFALGIELTSDGELEIGTSDYGLGTGTSRLDAALEDNFDDIDTLFNSENGIVSKLLEFTEQYTKSKGVLSTREDSLDDQVNSLSTDRENFEIRMISYEQTLRDRYISLDSTVARLNQSSSALFAMIG